MRRSTVLSLPVHLVFPGLSQSTTIWMSSSNVFVTKSLSNKVFCAWNDTQNSNKICDTEHNQT